MLKHEQTNLRNQVCPCCGRAFEKLLDYPLVFVHRVEILPIPEVIDYWSEDAALTDLEARRRASDTKLPRDVTGLVGINLTPQIAAAVQSEVVQNYLREIKNQEGREVEPSLLTPPLTADAYFKWAFPIPGSRLYLSLSEAEAVGEFRVCRVVLHSRGPNLGSQGGPTLQPLGAFADIHYLGRLLAGIS